MSTLLANSKIAKATHNISAYRFLSRDGVQHQDNDDDGESAAGGRLAHLLQLLGVNDVLVVVSRWYGGIHLGADRFKDINQVRIMRGLMMMAQGRMRTNNLLHRLQGTRCSLGVSWERKARTLGRRAVNLLGRRNVNIPLYTNTAVFEAYLL